MRFPRVVRLDDSDRQIYERLAVPGELAVPGAFAFIDVDPAALTGKQREAFAHAFLGVTSFGWSTLVEVDEITTEEYETVIEGLAAHFVEHYGAPSYEAARDAARHEAEFAVSICEHERHTLLSVEREVNDEGVVENFRVVAPASGLDHSRMRLWGIVED